MSLKSFLKERAIRPENVKVAISDRFLEEDGTPEQWELRSISEKENQAIKDSCTTKTMRKGRQEIKFDGPLYTKRMTAASVVYPDLTNAELQQSYSVVGEVALLEEMLLPGEMTILNQIVQQLNGYDEDKLDEDKETVKNS